MAGIPARVTGILTIMLGARRSKSSACFTIASLSRYNRGSVWIESRPFLPFCCSKIGLSSAAALADISRTTCQAISSSLATGNSFASAWILPFQTSNSFLRTLTTMTGLHVAPTAPFSSEYWSSEIEAESFQRQVGVVCVISWSRLLYVEVVGGLFGRSGERERFQSVFTGRAGRLTFKNAIDEVADLGEIGIGERRKKIVGDRADASVRGQESRRRAVKAPDLDGAFRADDFRAHVVAVLRLRVRFDLPVPPVADF